MNDQPDTRYLDPSELGLEGPFVRSENKMTNERVWISWYNRPRQFDNGILWLRVSLRLRRWHEIGGLWFSRRFPFFKVLLPQRHGPAGPAWWRS